MSNVRMSKAWRIIKISFLTTLSIAILFLGATIYSNASSSSNLAESNYPLATPASYSPPPTSSPSNPVANQAITSSRTVSADSKPYVASVCTSSDIPYTTSYQNVSYISQGQTTTSEGIDGSIYSCTADSTGFKPQDIINPPLNKIVYVGIGQPIATLAPISQPQKTELEAENYCTGIGVPSDSSAWTQCINIYLH